MHSSAAGHVDAGDTYETAAHRELEEGLGIANAKLKFIGKFKQIKPGSENELCGLFLAYHDGPYSNWEAEAENINFFTLAELKRLVTDQPHIFTPTFKSAFALLVEQGHLSHLN